MDSLKGTSTGNHIVDFPMKYGVCPDFFPFNQSIVSSVILPSLQLLRHADFNNAVPLYWLVKKCWERISQFMD